MTDTKSLRMYEQVRSVGAEFGSYTPRFHRTAQVSEPNLPALKQRVTELEATNKSLEDRLRTALQANARLKEELAQMKTYNTKLLSTELSNSDSHYLVQELLITDVNHRLSDARQEACRFREEAMRHQSRAGAYVEDKRKLESILKRYRRMMAETITSKRRPGHSSLDTSQELPQLRTPLKSHKSFSLRTNMKLLMKYLQGLVTETNLRTTFQSVTATCKAVLGCKECSIYIYCKKLQKEYTALFGYHEQPARLLIGASWVIMNIEEAADYRDPLFKKLEDVGRGLIGTDYMVFPVSLGNQVVLVVQCEGIQYTPIENIAEVQLKIILTGIQSMITYFYGVKNQESMQLCINTTSSALNLVANCRTHAALSNAVHTGFPQLLGFQGASVLYVNEPTKEFFANVGSTNDEERYARGIVKYPSTLGFASTVLASRGSKTFTDIKRHTLYTADVDNLVGIREIHSGIMVCIPGTAGIVGILVLTNKLQPPITAEEMIFIESVAKALGGFISGINDTVEAMELTVQWRKTIERLVANVKNSEMLPESQGLVDVVTLMQVDVNQWAKKLDESLSAFNS